MTKDTFNMLFDTWEKRPRRVIDYSLEGDQAFANAFFAAFREALPEIRANHELAARVANPDAPALASAPTPQQVIAQAESAAPVESVEVPTEVRDVLSKARAAKAAKRLAKQQQAQ